MLTILGALLALWHHFWVQLRHLGSLLEHSGCTFCVKKKDWGAKGAQRGSTPDISSPIWAPFWDEILDFSRIFSKKSCVLHMLVFSIIFWLHWALFGIGSHAIRPRICSPNTLFSFCIFSKKCSLETFKWVTFWVMFDKICDFCVKEWIPKTASENVPLQTQTTP